MNLTLPSNFKSKKKFEEEIKNKYSKEGKLLHIDIDFTSVIRLKEDVKVVLTEETKQTSLEIFIEADNKEKVLKTAKDLKDLFLEKELENDKEKDIVDHINSISMFDY
jgi:hypothetical protein